MRRQKPAPQVRCRAFALISRASSPTDPLRPPYGDEMLLVQAILANELPSPPALERWFLEQPIPAVVAIALLGAVALFVLRERGQTRRGLTALAAALAVSAGLFVLATLVTTRREEVAQLTGVMIGHIERSDADAVGKMLADPLMIASAGEQVDEFTRDSFLAVVRGFKGFGVSDVTIRPRGAVLDGPSVARTRATIRAAIAGDARPFYSTWEFTWRQSGNSPWRLARLECLTIYGKPPSLSWVRYARSVVGSGGVSRGGLEAPRRSH